MIGMSQHTAHERNAASWTSNATAFVWANFVPGTRPCFTITDQASGIIPQCLRLLTDRCPTRHRTYSGSAAGDTGMPMCKLAGLPVAIGTAGGDRVILSVDVNVTILLAISE